MKKSSNGKEKKTETEMKDMAEKEELKSEEESKEEKLSPEAKIKILEEEIEKIKKEKDDVYDKYLRKLAEFDNYRKRIEKEKSEFQEFLLGEFIKELIPFFDNFEIALKNKEFEEKEGFRKGVELIFKSLKDTFFKMGLVEINDVGKEFDPFIHEAISKEESTEVKIPVVEDVFHKGYSFRNRLLRPCIVKVKIPKEEKALNINLQEEEEKIN
ncbi:MAG: nucleotide exchange factor GrpE [Acidobacteriota bacterium]